MCRVLLKSSSLVVRGFAVSWGEVLVLLAAAVVVGEGTCGEVGKVREVEGGRGRQDKKSKGSLIRCGMP